MKRLKINPFPLFVIVCTAIMGLVFFPYLPDKIPTHWNYLGQPDAYSSKGAGVVFPLIIMAILYAILIILPKIDPKRQNIEKFKAHFNRFVNIIFIFFFYVFALTIVENFYRFNLTIALIPAFAVLFFFCGKLVENAEPNWTIGIRTPWTLSNEMVWKKTHALGGRLFKICALIVLIGMFFWKAAFVLAVAPVIISALFLVIYSYLIYRSENKKII